MKALAIPRAGALPAVRTRREIAPHWVKVLRDVWASKTRTVLVALSIFVGVFAVGMIAGARVLLLDSLAYNADRLNPPAASFATDTMSEGMLDVVRAVPGVTDVSARMVLPAHVKLPGALWRDVALYALPDYDHTSVNRVFPQFGSWPPRRGQLLFERASFAFMKASVGQRVTVELDDGRQQELVIGGALHDLSVETPDTFSGNVSAFVSMDTLDLLGAPRGVNSVYVQTANPYDRAASRAIAADVQSHLQQGGVNVSAMDVPLPRELLARAPAESLLFLLAVLGIVLVFMSAFLVVNTSSALLAQQKRQIGVMKAVGGETRQMVAMYLAMVAVFGVLALAAGIPLGALGAQSLLAQGITTLNFDGVPFTLNPGVVALQVAAGLLLPLLAALAPILAGSRMTVRDAISDTSSSRFGAKLLDRLMLGLSVARPIFLSVRNLFRRTDRLALTMSTLVLAGASFVAVGSVQKSIKLTTRDQLAYKSYDVSVQLDDAAPVAVLRAQALAVPGVLRAEAWQSKLAARVRPDGTHSNTLYVEAPPPDSEFIRPIMLEGRWLLPQDRNAVVINTEVTKDESDLHVGDSLTLQIDRRQTVWRIVGLARGVVAGPNVYTTASELAAAIGEQGQARELNLRTAEHDPISQRLVARAVEERLRSAHIRASFTQAMAERTAFITHGWNIIVSFLQEMALLLAVVGGLGLMGTMSINVVERTREIGVMRAIGSSNLALMSIIVAEGMLVGVVSWCLGILASIPVALALSNKVGVEFANAPLTFGYSGSSAVTWLVLVIIIAAAGSLLPAWRAARLTVRDVLAYE